MKPGPAQDKQMAVWRHNSFLGHARMMQSQAWGIIQSATTTEESKKIAGEIAVKALELAKSLKQRIDR